MLPTDDPGAEKEIPPAAERRITTIPKYTPSTVGPTAKLAIARKKSIFLKNSFDTLSDKLIELDAEDESRTRLDYDRTLAGLELAKANKEAAKIELNILTGQKHSKATAEERNEVARRYFSAGSDLWRFKKRKARFGDHGVARLMNPNDGHGMGQAVLGLYRKGATLGDEAKGPSSWRRDALRYYSAKTTKAEEAIEGMDTIWCQATHMFIPEEHIKAAHIVPCSLGLSELAELLFGAKGDTLDEPGNSLILSNTIKGWFDKYLVVVVPLDPQQSPIRRWKIDVLCKDINNTGLGRGPDGRTFFGRDLHGRELMFRNDNRPSARFLYFHFIMALIRIKDLGREGWEDIWAKYNENRPFPTPSPYLRKSMLLAIATHFQISDSGVVASFLEGQGGFDEPVSLDPEEEEEAARRVHAAVFESIKKAEDKDNRDPDDSDIVGGGG
jgi:hypothetical protein